MIAWLVIGGGIVVLSWAVPKLKIQRQQARCRSGRHEWAYSGEVRTIAATRRCKHCRIEVERNVSSDRTPGPFVRTVKHEMPEADVMVYGVWGTPRVDRWTVNQMRKSG